MRVLSFDVGVRHLSYALLNQPGSEWKDLVVEKWECFDCITEAGSKVKDSSSVPLQNITRMVQASLLRRLPDLASHGSIDLVVIEQQPLRKFKSRKEKNTGSARNKVVGYTISTVCDMWFRVNAPKNMPIIRMESAKHKLQVHTDGARFFNPHGGRKQPKNQSCEAITDYEGRKKGAIMLCKDVLDLLDKETNRDAIRAFYMFGEKKDDLADSFLQGMYALQNCPQKQRAAVHGLKRPRTFENSEKSDSSEQKTRTEIGY